MVVGPGLSRVELTSSPNVGMVHRTAITAAIRETHGEVSFVFAVAARTSALELFFVSGTATRGGVVVVTAGPPTSSSG